MANGHNCKYHDDIEDRIYKLEGEDKVMNEKLEHLSQTIKELKEDIGGIKREMKALSERMATMSAKVAMGGVIAYTIINVLLKKLGA